MRMTRGEIRAVVETAVDDARRGTGFRATQEQVTSVLMNLGRTRDDLFQSGAETILRTTFLTELLKVVRPAHQPLLEKPPVDEEPR